MNIKPLGDRVLIKALDAEEVSKSGIIIPDTAKERPSEGKIVAVGPGRLTDKGDRVAPEVKLDGDDYLILRESDILAVL